LASGIPRRRLAEPVSSNDTTLPQFRRRRIPLTFGRCLVHRRDRTSESRDDWSVAVRHRTTEGDVGRKVHEEHGGAGSSGPSCHESHKPMKLKNGLEIHGGSCFRPKVTDADVYIGFDGGMSLGNAFPFDNGTEILFKISDGHAPRRVGEFKKLVTWTIAQLKAGKKVHAGCIGGHGRTGTFLAAIVAELDGEADPIAYVRTHYCSRAIETTEQVRFLVAHYGAARAEPRADTEGHVE